MRLNRYDIFDLELDKYIGERLTREEVSELTGIALRHVSDYPRENRIYKRRYVIENSDGNNEITIKLLEEWDKTRLLINPGAKK